MRYGKRRRREVRMSETAKNVSLPVQEQEQAAGVPVFNWRAFDWFTTFLSGNDFNRGRPRGMDPRLPIRNLPGRLAALLL
jgi:hypothetical protein